MVNNLLRSSVIFILIFFYSNSYSQNREEFSGKLAGWADLKLRFNAKGDGKADDTKALQTALDSLSVSIRKFNDGPVAYTVLYLPKGRYKISQTLNLKGKLGVMIIGEDPVNTIIEWAGKDQDTMFLSNGSAYFKISRIGWNANNREGIECLGIHWLYKWDDKTSRSYAPTNIELSDLIFFGNPSVGIGTGTFENGTGQSDSEITIRRCNFNGAKQAGIKIYGYNALDNWIWSCAFIDCNIGVQSSFGNYHAYLCTFIRSKVSDLLNRNGYYISARYSYSEDSRAFSIDENSSTNPFKRTFEGNNVVNSASIPIEYYHVGFITLFNNSISSTRDTINPFMVSHKSWAPAKLQMLSIGNHYGYFKQPLWIPNANKLIYSIGDQPLTNSIKSSHSKTSFEAKPPIRTNRIIFEIPRNANDSIIQIIINRAAKLNGKRPIVHFPYGEYILQKTIVIPENSDMQIVGDGFLVASILKARDYSTFKGYSLFLVKGPSFIEIRDLQFGSALGKKQLKAIVFENIDQKGASIKLDQLYSNSDTAVFINKLNYTLFEKNNSFNTDGNVIIGGEILRQGKGDLRVYAFGGQHAGIKVLNGATFVSKDCWWEGHTDIPLNISGDGRITIDGAKIAPIKADSSTICKIGDFRGQVSLMNMYIQGGIELKNSNSSFKFLGWNCHYYYKKDIIGVIPKNISGQVGFVGTSTQCFYKDDPDCKVIRHQENTFKNIPNSEQFLLDMTKDDRNAVPKMYTSLGKGVSNVYITRVCFDSFNISLQFNP